MLTVDALVRNTKFRNNVESRLVEQSQFLAETHIHKTKDNKLVVMPKAVKEGLSDIIGALQKRNLEADALKKQK